mmetsp:Transcript_28262/g.51094  ORF Transcript_28262/g.51094 Transcript_28262/m.51094 type:complete len:87 (+) Transcript_28262:272-532(+)
MTSKPKCYPMKRKNEGTDAILLTRLVPFPKLSAVVKATAGYHRIHQKDVRQDTPVDESPNLTPTNGISMWSTTMTSIETKNFLPKY